MSTFKEATRSHHRTGTQVTGRAEQKLIDELQERVKLREYSGYGSLEPVHYKRPGKGKREEVPTPKKLSSGVSRQSHASSIQMMRSDESLAQGKHESRTERMANIVKETKSLETAILRAYHEVDSAKEYDENIKQKFRRYFDRLGPLLREEGVSTRDAMEKCSKLQKLSQELTSAANDQARCLTLISNELKSEVERALLLTKDLDEKAKRNSLRDKTSSVLQTVKKVDMSLAQQLSALEGFKLQMTEGEMVRKNAISELRGLLRKLEQHRGSPSPPPGRKGYSRKKVTTANESSLMRTLSLEERSFDDGGESTPSENTLRKIRALQNQKDELKKELKKAQDKIQEADYRNQSLKQHIENLTGEVGRMHKMYKETEDSPNIKVPRVLVRTSSGHVTPTNRERQKSPEAALKELQELKAKLNYYKSSKAGGGADLKFQIRFMSILELVRRFLSSLRKVQKTIDNPSELSKHKERLERDKVELENYLKKHFKYLDKKRRQQLEQIQKENEARKGEAKRKSSPVPNILRASQEKEQSADQTGLGAQTTVFDSLEEDALGLVTSKDGRVPSLSSKNSKRTPRLAFMDTATAAPDTPHLMTFSGPEGEEPEIVMMAGPSKEHLATLEAGSLEHVPSKIDLVQLPSEGQSNILKMSKFASEGKVDDAKTNNLMNEVIELKQENERLKAKLRTSLQDMKTKKDFETLVKQVAQTTSELSEMERKNQEIARKLDEVEEENAELRAIKESQSARTTPTPSTARLQEQAETLVRRVESDLLGKIADINASLTPRYKQLGELERTVKQTVLKTQTVWKKKLVEHQEQILNLTDSLKQSTDALSKVNDELVKIKMERAQLQGSLKRAQKENTDALDRKEEEIKKLNGKLKDKKEKETEAEKLKVLEKEVEESEKERLKALERTSTAEGKMKALEGVVQMLREQVSETEVKAKQVEENIARREEREKKDKKALQIKIEALERENEDALIEFKREKKRAEEERKIAITKLEQTHAEIIQKLSDEREQETKLLELRAEEREKKANQEIQKLKNAIKEQASVHMESMEEKSKKLAELEKKLKHIKRAEQEGHEEKKEINMRVETLEEEKQTLEKKVQKLELQLTEAVEKYEEMERGKVEAEKNAVSFENKLKRMKEEWKKEQTELEKEIQGLEERKDRLEKDLKTSLQREEKSGLNLEKIETELKKKKNQASEREKEEIRVKNELEKKLQQEVEKVMHLAGELEKERKGRAKEQKELKEGRMAELETQIAVLKQKDEAATKVQKEKEKLLQEKDEKVQKEKQKRQDLKLELQQKIREAEEMENQIVNNQTRLKTMEQENKKMENELVTKHKEIEKLEASMITQQKDLQKQIDAFNEERKSGAIAKPKEQELRKAIQQKQEELAKVREDCEKKIAKIKQEKGLEIEEMDKKVREAQKEVSKKQQELEDEREAKDQQLQRVKDEREKREKLEKILEMFQKERKVKEEEEEKKRAPQKKKSKKMRQYKALLLREHQNYMMLDQDYTQTLNCIKTVATEQITACELENEEKQKQLDQLRKEIGTLRQERKRAQDQIRVLQREKESLANSGQAAEKTMQESLKGIGEMESKCASLEEALEKCRKERDVLREEVQEAKKEQQDNNQFLTCKGSSRTLFKQLDHSALSEEPLTMRSQFFSPGSRRSQLSPSKASSPSQKRQNIFKTGQGLQVKEGSSRNVSPRKEEHSLDLSNNHSRLRIKMSDTAVSTHSPLSARLQGEIRQHPFIEQHDKELEKEYDELMKKYKREKKESEREMEQLAQTNRQLRHEFEIKSDEYAAKIKQKKQRMTELEESVKLISETVRTHACTIQSITPLSYKESEDLQPPDDNQTIQDVLQFAEMRVQRFVALYKEPYERKKHFSRISKGAATAEDEIVLLREEVTRKDNKIKRLELEIDELESKQKESKHELDSLEQRIVKNDIEMRRNLQNANKKVQKYKELSKDQQQQIHDLKQRIEKIKEQHRGVEKKMDSLKQELSKIESPEERDKIIKELRRQNTKLNDEIENIRKLTYASDTETISKEKSGTLRTPRKCDTDLVLSKLTSSEVKLTQKLVKQDQGGQVWLLLEVLTPDLGKDQLPGFLLIREEDLPGKHYHLLSARVAKKTFPKVKDNERLSPIKAKQRMRELRDEKHSLVDQLRLERPKKDLSPRLNSVDSYEMKMEVLRVKMQRNTWEMEYLNQTQLLQKMSDFIEELNDQGAAQRYLKEIKTVEQQMSVLRKENLQLKDKVVDLETSLKTKERELTKVKVDSDNRGGTRNNEQYSFLDRTFSDADAQLIIYEFDQLERRAGGVVSPIMSQQEERLKERIMKLENQLSEKEEALNRVAKRVTYSPRNFGGDNEEDNKNLRSLFYKFVTKCPEFDSERERLLDMIYRALHYQNTDIEDIQQSRGISAPSWKSKKNLLAIYGKKSKFSSMA